MVEWLEGLDCGTEGFVVKYPWGECLHGKLFMSAHQLKGTCVESGNFKGRNENGPDLLLP